MPPEHGLAQRLGPLGRVEAGCHHQCRLRRRPCAEAQLAAGPASAAATTAAVAVGLGLGLGLVTPTTTGDEDGRHVGLRRLLRLLRRLLLRLLLRRRPAVASGPLARCRSVHGREALRAEALVTRARDEGLEQRHLRRLELHDGRPPLPRGRCLRGGCLGRVD